MRILISNDDGYQAPGIINLAATLAEIADVVVVAPERNRSGSSSALTLDTPLRVKCAANGFYFLDGTPADCVHIALTGFLKDEPDMVVAGINAGANLGDDVIYSGTVAAALEGRFLGLPALAVSLVGLNNRHYATAAFAARLLVARLQHQPLPPATILNVNVPDLPWDEIAGFQATRLGHRHRAAPTQRATDQLGGREIFWVGGAGPAQDAGNGTDFYALQHRYISVTPLHVDLTRHNLLERCSLWLEKLAP